MDLKQVLAALKAAGKEGTVAIYRRHGVQAETWGVSYAALGKLHKQLKQQPELAPDLWATGVHDAQILATKIADASAMSRRDLSRWMRETKDHVSEGAVATLTARSSHAHFLAQKWSRQQGEWVAAGGFSVFAQLAHEGRLEETEAKDVLGRVEQQLRTAPNRVRHAMNSALIAIGGAIDALTQEALRVADAVGTVEVDHGTTGCKTPDARSYILKVQQHRAQRGSRKPRQRSKVPPVTPTKTGKVEVENVNVPGSTSKVDSAKYAATKRALLKALPRRGSGLNYAEMLKATKLHLPETLFPGGAKSGWWVKTVQLDLEAKGLVLRQPGRPLRWRRA